MTIGSFGPLSAVIAFENTKGSDPGVAPVSSAWLR